MARGIQIGKPGEYNVDGKIKNIYLGDSNGIAKNILKIYLGDSNGIARKCYQKEYNALKFSSDENFGLNPYPRSQDGIIEYSYDYITQQTLSKNSSNTLTGTATQPIYLRGTSNTNMGLEGYGQDFSGKYIEGNIENLLDQQTVKNGQHPVMGEGCFKNLFRGCRSLIQPPELPATTLTSACYLNMFQECRSLTQTPALPATTLTYGCYSMMFRECTSLVQIPILPATTLADLCYYCMFQGCSSLKISNTQTAQYLYPYRIPSAGIGTEASNSLDDMFSNTGGTFKGSPDINITYYTDHLPIS